MNFPVAFTDIRSISGRIVYILMVIIMVFATVESYAQNPDLKLSQAERDSILKDYDNIFPIWGRKVVEAGFDIPYPAGLNINGYYAQQPIEINNLQLGIGNFPMQEVGIVQFGDSESRVATYNFRPDLWVLPFLNVYGIIGQGWTETDVKLSEPIEFETGVNQKGTYYGFGFTTAFGIKKNFMVIDINWSWADMELLSDPVRARVLGIRYGRNFILGGKKRLAVWVGTMNQNLETVTEGSVRLNEVLPGQVRDQLATREYQNSPAYRVLPQYRKDQVEPWLML